MATLLKREHLSGYKQVAGLLVRHGRSDLLRDTGLAEVVAEDAADEVAADADRLADDLERSVRRT